MSLIVGRQSPGDLQGELLGQWDGRPVLQIPAYDALPAFLINLVNAYDLWCYLSSYGGLTAGRVSADNSLFAYETEDKLHDAHHYAGPSTLFWTRFEQAAERQLWEPFGQLGIPRPGITRTIMKSLFGNQVIFAEENESLGLSFAYRWTASDTLGLVRTVKVTNQGDQLCRLTVLDGVRHVLPWGISTGLYAAASCLTRAYTRAEVDAGSRLGIFCLTSGIVDDAHPLEVLRANVAWCCGLDGHDVHLTDDCYADFRRRAALPREPMIAGQRTSFIVSAPEFTLQPGETRQWHMVLDAGLDHAQVVNLRQRLLQRSLDPQTVEREVAKAEQEMIAFVAAADGLQKSAETTTSVHHFANVVFNNLRGGRFVDDYAMARDDFVRFVTRRNHLLAQQFEPLWLTLPERCQLDQLLEFLRQQGNADLIRLGYEYLPISHSRRHGDPSRPWNKFAIRLKQPDGRLALHYEGNWRDIFQNWEALCLSYPRFIASVVAKFVNGTSAEGYNPYRVTSEGLEWEVPEPENPWSNIGYWGDHQIVYLLKLLELMQAHQPRRLQQLLVDDIFVYMRIPYRLRDYRQLVRNPRDTIDFDAALADQLADAVETTGEDAKLQTAESGGVLHVNLLEKILVPALSKLSNFVVGGGIWMNTQRPEWNDANNALVGYGTSLVTLCYLRRYLQFLAELIAQSPHRDFPLSTEVASWFDRVRQTLEKHRGLLDHTQIDNGQRRAVLDELGQAFSDYRTQLYDHGLTRQPPAALAAPDIERFCRLAVAYADHTIRLGARQDALYDSYSVIKFESDAEVSVKPLYEMLEGQVAAISSGTLSSEEVADLGESLFVSRIYRPDQNSFMLYPARLRPDFIERNVIPEENVQQIGLLTELVATGNRAVIYQDDLDVYRFAAEFQRKSKLGEALDRLALEARWRPLVDRDRQAVEALYERVFQHHTFTGRSEAMYGYEGIGCIYWHMVSKLLLAVQEQFLQAVDVGRHQRSSAAAVSALPPHSRRP